MIPEAVATVRMVDGDEVRVRSILARFENGWPEVIDIGPGWLSLLVRLDQELAAIDPDYVIQQVKSKFGSLSFYARAAIEPRDLSQEFHQTIRDAELASTEMCEECGGPARTYTICMWVWTLCEEHAKVKRGDSPSTDL